RRRSLPVSFPTRRSSDLLDTGRTGLIPAIVSPRRVHFRLASERRSLTVPRLRAGLLGMPQAVRRARAQFEPPDQIVGPCGTVGPDRKSTCLNSSHGSISY